MVSQVWAREVGRPVETARRMVERNEFIQRFVTLDFEEHEIESPTGETVMVAEVFETNTGNVVMVFWS